MAVGTGVVKRHKSTRKIKVKVKVQGFVIAIIEDLRKHFKTIATYYLKIIIHSTSNGG